MMAFLSQGFTAWAVWVTASEDRFTALEDHFTASVVTVISVISVIKTVECYALRGVRNWV